MFTCSQYLADIRTILAGQKKFLSWLMALFFIVSLLDLVGIGLVGGYISLLTQPENSQVRQVQEWLTENFSITDQDVAILSIGGVLIALFVVKAASSIFVNRQILLFSNRQMVRLRSEAMIAFQSLAYEKFLHRNSAEYVQAVQSYVNQATGSLVLLLRMISEGVVAIVILILLVAVNAAALSLLVLLSITLFVGYDRLFRRRLLDSGRIMNRATEDVIQGIQEGFSGMKEIRILGKEEFFLDRVVVGSKIVARIAVFIGVISYSPRYLIEVVVVFFVVSLVIVFYVQTGSLETAYPLIGMFGVAALRLGPAITMVISSIATLRNQRHGLGVLAGELSKSRGAVSLVIQNNSDSVTEKFNRLELDRIVFTYDGAIRPAIKDLSMSVRSGESIGLIGQSGSGKTTLVDIMLGLLVPQEGHISFNHKELHSSYSEWRANVAYLPQEVFLRDASLRRNIALGVADSDIDDDLLWEVIHQVRLIELVNELPRGVDTAIGERGVRLSGGQRQRVALARAFYHGREVLVLDEATSALDHETEREIVKEIQEFKGKKTMIVIAHRLSTLEHCDKIYRLRKGRVIQAGTYNEIIADSCE